MTYIATAINQVIVNQESDFPEPSGGSITMDDNITYVIGQSFTMTNKLICGQGNTLWAQSSQNSIVTYNGTGDFITMADSTLVILAVGFLCPNAQFMVGNGGTLNPLAPVFFTSRDLFIFGCDKVCTLTNISVTMGNAGIFMNDGMTLISSGGVNFAFLLNDVAMLENDASSVAVDFGTSVFNNVAILEGIFIGLGTGVSGMTSSANVDTGTLAIVDRTNFTDIATPLDTIMETDLRWSFRNCSGVPNTVKAVEISTSASTTVTIGTATTFVAVGGVNWISELESKFTTDTAGNITYNAEQQDKFFVIVTATVEKVGGGTDQLCARIAHDTGGGYVTSSRTESCTENSAPTSITCHGVYTLDTGDRLTIFVANQDSTSNITVSVSNFTVINNL